MEKRKSTPAPANSSLEPETLPKNPSKSLETSAGLIKMGAKFHKSGSSIYLECINPSAPPYRQLFLETQFLDDSEVAFLAPLCKKMLDQSQYFGVFLYKGEDVTGGLVGGVQTTYVPGEKVDITEVNILSPYQRKGYGTAALRTLFGIYTSPKRGLDFDKFCLCVQTENEGARKFWDKLEFMQDPRYPSFPIGGIPLYLPRSKVEKKLQAAS